MRRLTILRRTIIFSFLFSVITVLPAYATIIETASGVSSAGIPISLRAELTISGDTLTILLSNISAVPSSNPNDLLSSFFFDILDGMNNRPVLTYESAIGDVWLTDKSAADVLQTADYNLKAVNHGDRTWQFLALNASSNPFLGFGIGTVGNNNMSPNNFNGGVVDGMDYAIYAGDVTTQNLHDRLLVRDMATFTFSGLTGFTEADIEPVFAFGLGTAPDSIIWTPEPTAILLLMFGSLTALRRRYK